MASIGFTTGSLYLSNVSFEKRIKLYHNLGADAIELSFVTPSQLLEYQPSDEEIKNINKFKLITIHAPWKEVEYSSNINTDNIIKKLRLLSKKFNVGGIVLHPTTIKDFKKLEESELPFLLENMDKRKEFSTNIEHFKELKEKCKFGFVLDLQHVYEHDPTMKLAEDLIDIMGKRLKHMHVSGYDESFMHIPVNISKNKDAITKILELRIDIPKICEGLLSKDINKMIKDELSYIRKYEKS